MKRKAEPDAEEMTSSKGPSTSKKLAPDAANDFINETELQKSIQVSVLKTADAVAQLAREGDGGGQVQFHPDVIAQVSALIWDTVSGDWTSDLLAFSGHGGRQVVNVSDVALIMRRNKHLLDIVSKAADIDLGDYERPVTKRQRSNNKESTRGKRGARQGPSRPGTALDTPVPPSGTLTPRSDHDANSRSSFIEEVKQKTVSEQKVTTVVEAVPEDDFDDDVMIVDAPSKPAPPMKEEDVLEGVVDGDSFSRPDTKDFKRTQGPQKPIPENCMDTDEDDFSILDVEPTSTAVTKRPVHASTPVSSGILPGRASLSTNGPLRRSARNTSKTAVEMCTPSKSPHTPLIATNLSLEGEQSPKEAKSDVRRKPPSPDLFSTPVKENNSDDFDDLFEIPDQKQESACQHHQLLPKSKGNDDGTAPRKSDGGWSVKFSEFSFFDDDSQEQSNTKEAALQPPMDLQKPTSSASSSKSRNRPSSTTPRSSNMVLKSKQGRSGAASSKQSSSLASKRCLEKQPMTTPKRANGLRSRLKDCEGRVSKPPAPVLVELDSDEEFFALK